MNVRVRPVRRRLSASLFVLITAVASTALVGPTPDRTPQGQEPAKAGAAAQAPPNRYVGAARCKGCHNAADSGDQYGRWTQEKHSKAFEVLASAEAKKYGKERGVDDPQKSDKCLKCHVTAYGKPAAEVHRTFDPKLGVQCETCHGPGELHMRERMKAAATAGKEKPAYTEVSADEIVRNPDGKLCINCHNEESPGYKPFCAHRFKAQIRHLNPKKPRTADEMKALLACSCDDKCVCKKDGKCDGEKAPDGKEPKDKQDGK